MSTIFTKAERTLITNNKKFNLQQQISEHSDDRNTTVPGTKADSRYYKALFENTVDFNLNCKQEIQRKKAKSPSHVSKNMLVRRVSSPENDQTIVENIPDEFGNQR